MTDDHKAEAERLANLIPVLAQDQRYMGIQVDPLGDNMRGIALAQVHATLYAAEQQRIANDQNRATNAILAGILVTLAKPGAGVRSWADDSDSAVHSILADTETWRGMGTPWQVSSALGIEVDS